MIKHVLLVISLFLSVLVNAQASIKTLEKPPITPAQFGKWPTVIDAKISDDGKRILYRIYDPTAGQVSYFLFTIETGRHQKLDSVPAEFKESTTIVNNSTAFQKLKSETKVIQPGVDVWSYTDAKLQSQQLEEINESNKEQFVAIGTSYALIASAEGADNEWGWNSTSLKTIYLVSKDGSRKILDTSLAGGIQNISSSYWITPREKFVVYYDVNKKNYFSYEISTGTKRNLTSSIQTPWTTYVHRDIPSAYLMPIGVAGYIGNDEAVLIKDQWDIFQIDPSGKKLPINLTNSYGRSRNIELRPSLEDESIFKPGESIILSGFNRVNKNDGFYKITLGISKTPELLTSGPYVYKGTWEDDNYTPLAPVKAKKADVYLVRRMSAKEFPNYFWTKDFKTFNRITDVHPERSYNWLTTELITWKLPDSSSSQGILYKPENFDPKKKYPVIFYYYENSTEGLNGFPAYPILELTHGTLNIPYYVSNEYLVFTPDIHYEIGYPGQSVLNTIVSAANYLSKFSYVDPKHMGLQGHSRGGWETNFIVTHTNIFAAAMSASGLTDYVSMYTGIRTLSTGLSRQSAYEKSYQRIGSSLWERLNLYIENSPVFKADRVTTPLLMMANKLDNDIPFEQGVELFTALRRLGKRAWMLQYDGEGHVTLKNKSREDLETRMKQFFDHYLKDSACPRWMLYGVPAAEKGNPDALKLVYEKDPKTGKWLTPKEGGLLTEEEKKKVEALKHRKPVTVTIE